MTSLALVPSFTQQQSHQVGQRNQDLGQERVSPRAAKLNGLLEIDGGGGEERGGGSIDIYVSRREVFLMYLVVQDT